MTLVNDAATRIGGAIYLFMRSPEHQAISIEDARKRLIAPIRFEQCRLYWADNLPFAWISFALITPEVEARILSDLAPEQGQWPALELHEWNRGDRLWVIDFLAPFGGARAVIANLRREWWLPQSVAMSMRATESGPRFQKWVPRRKHERGEAYV